MKIRDATPSDLPFIVAANTALAAETDGQNLDPALLEAGVRAVFQDPAPPHRGDGVFRALYGHLEAIARADFRVCGIRLYVDRGNERAQSVYRRLGMHRSNYGVMETVYRGPTSREES